MSSMDSPWLDVPESSKRSKRHPKTLLRALRRGELVGYQASVNGTWRIHVDDLDAWIRGEKPTRKAKAC